MARSWHLLVLLSLAVFCWDSSQCVPFTIPYYGRWVIPTVGEIWPKPQQQTSTSNFLILRPSSFQFKVVGETCDIVNDAIKRYYDLIFYPRGRTRSVPANPSATGKDTNSPQARDFLDLVNVDLRKPCENLPSADMVESYFINVLPNSVPPKAEIVSDTEWGILRGLESFSQLVYSSTETGIEYQINETQVIDYPRFRHRGLMIDTARHFIPLKTMKKMTDLIAQNKMNVLHWHMTDDASFPYVSSAFPSLSQKGSFQEYSHVYSPNDIRIVIEYARLRGVRVIPEFDSPDHTQSWKGQSGLLTVCYDTNGVLRDDFGPIDPSKPENFVFLKNFFKEVADLFPDTYMHLGGDEVTPYCWQNNPDVQNFMTQMSFTDIKQLEGYYMSTLMEQTAAATGDTKRYIVWQEVVDNGATLRQDTVISVWKDQREGTSYQTELPRIAQAGHQMILTGPWYLNYISYGLDWDKYYAVEPLNFTGTVEQKKLVIGGEVTMWGEYVDSVSLIPRTWPRASAVAERLWSPASVNSPALAAPRLEEHRCRLLRRGYNVDPVNGANFCEEEWDEQ